MLDSLRGGFLGLALGDALGAPHEFRYSIPVSQYTGRLQYPTKLVQRYSSPQFTVVGQVTDDTTMAGALMRTILQDKDWVKEHVIQAYINWANSGIKFMGRNTRALFKGISTVAGYYSRFERLKPDSQSNGSLMRAYPLVLLFNYLPEMEAYQKAMEDTSLTNPTSVNRDAVLIYLTALRLATTKGNPQSLISLAQTEPIREALTQGFEGKTRNVTYLKGWVAHPIYLLMQGWLQAITGRNFSQVIHWIISQGGDTDTNAAIVGSLLGVYYGEKAMLEDPLTRENVEILLSADYTKGDLPTDPVYHPANLLHLLQ